MSQIAHETPSKNTQLEYVSKPIENARFVDVVIKKLLEIVPCHEYSLVCDLEAYYNSLWNQSPEALKTAHCWTPLQNIMNNHVQDLDEPWKIKAICLFNQIQ